MLSACTSLENRWGCTLVSVQRMPKATESLPEDGENGMRQSVRVYVLFSGPIFVTAVRTCASVLFCICVRNIPDINVTFGATVYLEFRQSWSAPSAPPAPMLQPRIS